MDQHYIWALDGRILLCYAASAAAFFAVVLANLKLIASARLRPRLEAREAPAEAGVLLAAAALNFVTAALLAKVCDVAGVASRQSMIAFPLLMLGERHFRLGLRQPSLRPAHGRALLGGVIGMAGGALVFLQSDFQQGAMARAVVPGDVDTMPLERVVEGGNWAVSMQLVVFYVLSLGIFFGLHRLYTRAAKRWEAPLREGKALPSVCALAGALAANALGVFLLMGLGRWAKVEIRQAMMIVPLYLITEAYVKTLRADQANRRANWLGLVGSFAGMAAAGFKLLRHAPLH